MRSCACQRRLFDAWHRRCTEVSEKAAKTLPEKSKPIARWGRKATGQGASDSRVAEGRPKNRVSAREEPDMFARPIAVPVRAPARPGAARNPRRWRGLITAALGLLLAGCGAADFSTRDLRVSASGDTLYVFARNQNVSRNFCASLGGDVARTEGRLASADTRTMRLGRVMGCYTARPIAVCAQDDADCLALAENEARD